MNAINIGLEVVLKEGFYVITWNALHQQNLMLCLHCISTYKLLCEKIKVKPQVKKSWHLKNQNVLIKF